MNVEFNKAQISELEKRYRVQLINSLSGFKSANLVGTKSADGVTNLAIVSSVFHLGASPALMGMIIRPDSVPRDTLTNIKETGVYTLNHVGRSFYKQAHQTSARYKPNQSEFNEVGLDEYYIDDFYAPFVSQSALKIGLNVQQITPLSINNTVLVIGEIIYIAIEENALCEDGYVDIEALDTVALSGLDSYHTSARIARLSYAKVNEPITELAIGKKGKTA